jgi:hypothetical protein
MEMAAISELLISKSLSDVLAIRPILSGFNTQRIHSAKANVPHRNITASNAVSRQGCCCMTAMTLARQPMAALTCSHEFKRHACHPTPRTGGSGCGSMKTVQLTRSTIDNTGAQGYACFVPGKWMSVVAKSTTTNLFIK